MPRDPDQICIDRAAELLAPELQALGVNNLGQSQVKAIVTWSVLGWLSGRPAEWSRDRAIAHMGEPDAYNCGWAEAILPNLAQTDFDFKTPLFNWSKADITKFLATAHEMIEEQKVATLETQREIPF